MEEEESILECLPTRKASESREHMVMCSVIRLKNTACEPYFVQLPVKRLLTLHTISVAFHSSLADKVTVVKDPFQQGSSIREGIPLSLGVKKNPIQAFELLPPTLIKNGLSSAFKWLHLQLGKSVRFSKWSKTELAGVKLMRKEDSVWDVEEAEKTGGEKSQRKGLVSSPIISGRRKAEFKSHFAIGQGGRKSPSQKPESTILTWS